MQEVSVPAALCACWSDPDGKKDVVAVLAHLLLFAPVAAFPRLSASALAMAEAALQDSCCEEKVYQAAAVLVSVAQRLEKSLNGPPLRQSSEADAVGADCEPPAMHMALTDLHQELDCLLRIEGLLTAAAARRTVKLSAFVESRVIAASDYVRRVLDQAGASQSTCRPCSGGYATAR